MRIHQVKNKNKQRIFCLNQNNSKLLIVTMRTIYDLLQVHVYGNKDF